MLRAYSLLTAPVLFSLTIRAGGVGAAERVLATGFFRRFGRAGTALFALIAAMPALAQETPQDDGASSVASLLRGSVGESGSAQPREPAINADSDIPIYGSSRNAPRRPGEITPDPTSSIVQQDVTGTVARPVRSDVIEPVATLPAARDADAVQRRARVEEDDPFAPLGVRIGNLELRPAIETSLGYDDNPNRSGAANPKGSLVSRTEGEIGLQSDWSVHELTGQLRAGYSAFTDVSDANRPDASGRLTYRHDFSRQTQGLLEARLNIDTERPGSPELAPGVSNRPIVASYGLDAGVTHALNRLSLGLRGSIDRVTYEDAEFSDGTRIDQSDRAYNQFGVRLRAGYEATPGLIPFVEVSVDTRQYDNEFDNAGFARSSNGLGLRAGSTFEITRKLTGEVSAGYRTRRYDDERLTDLRGPVADAAITWSVSPLTNVRLDVASTIDETTIVGSSGAFTRRAGVEVTHDLRRNVRLTGALAFARTDYDGIDLTEDLFSASIRADYKLNRNLVLRASYAHERLESTALGSDYSSNVYLLGVRLQR